MSDDGLTITGPTQTVASGASSATMTNPTSAGCRKLRLVATAAAFVKIGPAASPGSATSADFYLAPNIPEIILIGAGPVKVSAIQVSAAGSVYVTEVN